MNDATRAAQQASHPATLRLPVAFGYPVQGIVGRAGIGICLLAVGGFLLSRFGGFWMFAGAAIALFGILVLTSNLLALLRPDRRKIVLSDDGVEIRYGFSTRSYRFLDYSDYRISRLGLRRFLTALPLDVERALGDRARRVRVTLYDRPAFITPMPLLGDGAPASLLEWQSTLNELRRAAIAAAGLAAEFDRETREESADEARRMAEWRALEQRGARPSRLSRAAYARGRIVLAILFFVVLLAPLAMSYALKHRLVVVCGAADSSCHGFDPTVLQIVSIGGPLLAVLIFVAGSARIMVRRAHDLGEDLSYWRAAMDSFSRRGLLLRRLGTEVGTRGANRFGPEPRN